MFMIGESMRIGIATDHVPLSKVPELITVESAYEENKADESISYTRFWYPKTTNCSSWT